MIQAALQHSQVVVVAALLVLVVGGISYQPIPAGAGGGQLTDGQQVIAVSTGS